MRLKKRMYRTPSSDNIILERPNDGGTITLSVVLTDTHLFVPASLPSVVLSADELNLSS